MLNYIWMFLLVIAIIVAVGIDIHDELGNTYRNNIPCDVTIALATAPDLHGAASGSIRISKETGGAFYNTSSIKENIDQPVTLLMTASSAGSITINLNDGAPLLWQKMAKGAVVKDKLSGTIQSIQFSPDKKNAAAKILLEPIHFLKMKAITQAAIDFAGTAVEIALGLIGVMALWLGLMKIAEEAGLVKVLTKILAPITKKLFPEVPPDHPAIGAIIMNIAANMLGLNNAATPLGLKAMEELNKLNPKLGTATNAMVTFLAINTGGLILIPATAIAVRAASGSANPGIIIGTSIFGAFCATAAGVGASKILQRLKWYKSDFSKNGLK